jgi:integrase
MARPSATAATIAARFAVGTSSPCRLRRQCAGLLFAPGADVKQVQHFLGHSRASVTLDIDRHLLTGGDGEMARRGERVLVQDTSAYAL